MNLSIFDVLGPVMIGPSSSHTAGAARLARAGLQIAGGRVKDVSFGLAGSFFATHKGHGTDKALVAGALGLKEDDERLPHAFALAKQAGLSYSFYEAEAKDEHENTVWMTFIKPDGEKTTVVGCSLGGGRIRITRIDAFVTDIQAELPTVVVLHEDRKGVISRVSSLLAQHDINIAIMRLTRENKGGLAAAVFETDEALPAMLIEKLEALDEILSVRTLGQ